MLFVSAVGYSIFSFQTSRKEAFFEYTPIYMDSFRFNPFRVVLSELLFHGIACLVIDIQPLRGFLPTSKP